MAFQIMCIIKQRSILGTKDHGLAIAHGLFPNIGNYGPLQNWDLSIPSERAPSKLSENHKIIEFGPPEL